MAPRKVRDPVALPPDPVLSVEDARAHMHALVSQAGDGEEFLIGPRRRPTARLVPYRAPAGNHAGVALVGPALDAVLSLAGDSLGFALAQEHAETGNLALPAAVAPFVAALDPASTRRLADHTLAAFHAAGGDTAVTVDDVNTALG